MYRSATEFLIREMEDDLGVDLDYLRTIAGTSGRAFFKFLLFAPLSRHREHVSAAAAAVARIVSTRAADCGTCVQIAVNEAHDQEVPRAVVEAALADEPERLPEELAVIYRFSRAVATGAEAEEAREAVLDRLGRDALVDLSIMIATAQVFPLVKRGLGRSEACTLVELRWEGTSENGAEALGTTSVPGRTLTHSASTSDPTTP